MIGDHEYMDHHNIFEYMSIVWSFTTLERSTIMYPFLTEYIVTNTSLLAEKSIVREKMQLQV